MTKKDTRLKNNLLSSFIYQLILISLSFLLPRLYLVNFGSEVNGVLSTIKQIFMYMMLLESGVGLATTQALYKKIGNNDYQGANSVLSATHRYYVKTGYIYLVIVIIIAVVYSFLIPNAINSTELFFIVILTALPALFSYFVQAKYRILMEVDGRKYVINNSETVVQIMANGGKVLVLFLTDSLVLIQFVYCVISLGQLVFLYLYAKRKYKWLNLNSSPDYNSISQKGSVLIHQLSGMVFNNTDVILISAMCDFKAVSVYAIYNIFFSQVQNFITSILSSFNFALGQMFHKDKEKFCRVYNVYETFYIMITFIIYTIMAVFMLPLIQIYTGGVTDANYANVYLIFLFALMSLLSNGKLPANSIIEYSGDFAKTRSHALWEMIINIASSVVAIYYFGICGAILGTIVALLYRSVVMIYFSNKKILGRSTWATYKIWLANGGVFAIVMFVFFVDSFANLPFLELVLNGVIHSVWILVLYILANFIFNKSAFKTILELYREKKKA